MGWGGYLPWYSNWGLGSYWGYPYDYGYSYYPSAGDYYYSYAPSVYNSYYPYASNYPYASSDYGDTNSIGNPVLTAPQQFADSPSAPPPTAGEGSLATDATGGQQASGEAMNYYSEARAAFLQGNYQNALRLASHAAVDEPGNPKAHELMSLALFALGNYGPAAGEAHAAMALGSIADWTDLFNYYNDAQKFTTQLRALEKAVAANPKDAADHFLLGYQYLMIGARDNAKTQFAAALKRTPGDKLASRYLQELQSNSPRTPPRMASKQHGTAL